MKKIFTLNPKLKNIIKPWKLQWLKEQKAKYNTPEAITSVNVSW